MSPFRIVIVSAGYYILLGLEDEYDRILGLSRLIKDNFNNQFV